MRADLLALTADDLVSFSNRGLTRRAEQEASAGGLTCEISESAEGDVAVRWSDGVECRLPANARLTDSRCTCPSTTLCRHVLRSVFAYQKFHAGGGTGSERGTATKAPSDAAPEMAETEGAAATVAEPRASAGAAGAVAWNPGEISDAQLTPFFSATELARWQREFASGHVIQVWTGVKPRALLHTLGCTVNFLVPRDPRYAVCDCAAEAPCGHVGLAVWAFRELRAGERAGLISTAQVPASVPGDLLEEIEREVAGLAATGLARSAGLQVDRWRRLSERVRTAGLVWPAEVLRDIAELQAAYLAHDARFSPREFAAAIAELLQRIDAIRAVKTPVPALFVRGSPHDREMEFGSARLIGLGCTARAYRGGAELAAHLQDSDSGAVISIVRHFADPAQRAGLGPASAPKAFAELARTMAVKGATLAAIGRGQLLIKGGRRTPSGQFLPGRAPASVAPQAYAWETLRAPLRVAGFAEMREQLGAAPPVVLGPRRVVARLMACPLAGAIEAEFVAARQEIVAKVKDAAGETAWLVHPYVSRGAMGAERLLAKLTAMPEAVRFVCAEVRLAGAEIVLAPLSVVFEEAGRRTCVQPWVDEAEANAAPCIDGARAARAPELTDPVHDYLEELIDLVAETWLTGARATADGWRRLSALGVSLGFGRLADFRDVEQPARLMEIAVAADFAHREFSRLDAGREMTT